MPNCDAAVFQILLDTLAAEVPPEPGRSLCLALDYASKHDETKSLLWSQILLRLSISRTPAVIVVCKNPATSETARIPPTLMPMLPQPTNGGDYVRPSTISVCRIFCEQPQLLREQATFALLLS